MDIAGHIAAYLPGLGEPLRMNGYGFGVQEVDYRDDPGHDEAWVDREAARYGGRRSVWWRQNYERELIRGGQAVWPMLSREVHLRTIPPQELCSAAWSVYRGLDHGIRHPTCCAWAAVNKGGDLYVFRQYYATDRTISHNVKAILQLSGRDEYVHATVADPSLAQRNALTLEPLSDLYRKEGLTLLSADNSAAGYELLTAMFVASLARQAVWSKDLEGLKSTLNAPTLTLGDAQRLAQHRALWFSPSVAQGQMSVYEQVANLRWRQATGDPTQRAAPATYVDVDDEGPDVVRYLAQTSGVVRWRPPVERPEAPDLLRMILSRAAPAPSQLD